MGVGVNESTSNLLIANCDEFIYYDDTVREVERRKPVKKKTNTRAGLFYMGALDFHQSPALLLQVVTLPIPVGIVTVPF